MPYSSKSRSCTVAAAAATLSKHSQQQADTWWRLAAGQQQQQQRITRPPCAATIAADSLQVSVCGEWSSACLRVMGSLTCAHSHQAGKPLTDEAAAASVTANSADAAPAGTATTVDLAGPAG